MASKAAFNIRGITLTLANGEQVILNAGENIQIFPSGDLITFSAQFPNAVVNNVTAWQPPSISNANAPKNSVYFSTDANKLVYRSADGLIHNLY